MLKRTLCVTTLLFLIFVNLIGLDNDSVDSLWINMDNTVFNLNMFADNDQQRESSFNLLVRNPVITTDCNTLDFGELFVDSPETKTFTIQNIGSESLSVSGIICENEFVTIDPESLNLDPNETQEVLVTLSTNYIIDIEDTIQILSNDNITPTLEITILGEGLGVFPPDICVSQEFINVIMEPETETNHELVISNIGFYDLNVEIEAEDEFDAGKALSLNGDGSFVNLGNDESMKPDFPFTVSAWIRVTGESMEIFANDASSHDYNGLWILVNSSRRISLTTGNGGVQSTSSRRSCTSSQVLDLNTWYHVAMVGYSFSEREIYINGEQMSCSWSGGATEMNYSDGDAMIGRYYDFNYLDGNVDDFRFWNYARSESEIQNTMHSGLTGEEEGLIGYWDFDGANPLSDVSGNGNDGMVSGLIEITESSAPITGWFEANPKTISIEPQSNESIGINLNSYVLTSGSHDTNLKIYSNDPDSPELNIPVSMTIDSSSSDEDLESIGNMLKRNYPNPFNPTTKIEFNLKTTSNIKLNIYNVKGQKIRSFVGNNYPGGMNTITWNGTDDNKNSVSSGIYFYQLRVDDKVSDTKKCLLLK